MKYKPLLLNLTVVFLLFSTSCRWKRNADLILYQGTIYTVDPGFSVVEAIAVHKGIIVAVGSADDIFDEFDAPVKIDLKGKAVYPGFIDAHCHFFGYGSDLIKCDLYGSTSFDEIINRVAKYSETNQFKWLLGRGWDQNLWENKEFPDNGALDSLFPTTPVYLVRIDGHAALCNSAALRIASITTETKVNGGEVVVKNGKLTGILIDNAMELVNSMIPEFSKDLNVQALLKAQQMCFAAGLTTVDDAGLSKETIQLISQMQKADSLKMRVYAMIADEPKSLKYFISKGRIKTDRLDVRAIKIYADGALGSRGACLKKPYTDQPGNKGFLLHKLSHFDSLAILALRNGFQLCTHAIGDSAVNVMLNIYAHHLEGGNDRRWRIEHCQVVDPKDLKLFGDNSIIPSVQPTHATSDMSWAESRLGPDRIKNAYTYKTLKEQAGGMIVFGTDFPVEEINPLYTFYAATARKNKLGQPPQGFQVEEIISRQDALRAMTIWAAFSNFEDDEKGSIEEGKFADFVILDSDIMKIDADKIPNVKVLSTYIDGEKVYGEMQ